MRPSWDVYFMRLAYLAATRASCNRKHVGAVIVTPEHRVAATGYNGAPSGRDSCDEIGHEMVDDHCVRTLHAESNAIDYAGRMAFCCCIYTTVIPCYDCAKRIVNVGINRVVYDGHYESRYGKSSQVTEFLQSATIEVVQLDDPGVILFKEMLGRLEAVEREILHSVIVEYECGCAANGDTALERCREHGAARSHD